MASYHKVVFLLIIYLLLACSTSNKTSTTYDLLIRNASIQTGDGSDPYISDVAITANTIERIGENLPGIAAKEIDAIGLTISPGFIDVHAHLEPLTIFPTAESHIRMGVTTALGGPDGGGPLPLGEYLDSLQAMGIGLNVGYLVGHNTVRNHIMGLEDRSPSPTELNEMKSLVEKSMLEGAFGISTGLKYLPGAFAKFQEIVELSRSVSAHGGIYTSHLREEGLGLIEAVAEAIQISEDASIPVVLTHHKAIGQPMWGKSKQTLQMVTEARGKGLDVMVDQYPYTASYTSISVLIPPWSMVGGRYDAFAKRCEDPVLRDSIKAGIKYNIINDRGGGDLNRIQIAKFNWKPQYEGKTLFDWAIDEGLEPTPDNGAELVIQAQLHRGASCIYHAMNEEDVERIMKFPYTMIASDGRLTEFQKGFPHPRAYGTFPRVLGHYVREKALISLEEAIRKMTSLPAQRLGLKDRGLLKVGMKADITIFNPDVIVDKATFTQPHQYPLGIHYVIVNGKIALEGELFHDTQSGMVLRGPAFKSIDL